MELSMFMAWQCYGVERQVEVKERMEMEENIEGVAMAGNRGGRPSLHCDAFRHGATCC